MGFRDAIPVLSDLAADQWGLVATAQAVTAGVSRSDLARLCQAGVLDRVGHGVYVVRAAAQSENVDLRAAWLALDPARSAADRLRDGPDGPVVSHASAAALHDLGDLDADRHEFTLPVRKQSRRADVRLHRGVIGPEDVTVRSGLPVTTPDRTVVDLLADGHDGDHVAGVLADAVRTRLIDPASLAGRLRPFAARFVLPRDDGDALLRHLSELGGVAEQIDADQIAQVARATGVPVPSLIATLTVAVARARQDETPPADDDPVLRAAMGSDVLRRAVAELDTATSTVSTAPGIRRTGEQAVIHPALTPPRRRRGPRPGSRKKAYRAVDQRHDVSD